MESRFKISAIVLSLLIQACSYTNHTKPLDQPILREDIKPTYYSTFDGYPAGIRSASIGDELFRLKRSVVGEAEKINYWSPTSQSFPNSAEWKGTHVFNDGRSGDLIVYTTPIYHKGQIGVILDKEESPATRKSLVQLAGVKEGRRWALMRGGGKFFSLSERIIDYWGLRYGGLSDGEYVFEIINKSESQRGEILQSIKITESQFLGGFTVRGVKIKGLEKDKQGVIKFQVSDQLTSNN